MVRRALPCLFPASSSVELRRLTLLLGLCVALASALPAVASAAGSGPVASYSFDEVTTEGETETVEDRSGNGHTATVHGAEWTAKGRFGGAVEFRGAETEYLSVPDSSEFDFTEEFTLEAWVRPSTIENFYSPVVDKLAGGGGHTNTFSYGLYAGNWEHKPFGEVENPLGSGRSVTAPEAIEARAWTHLALTFDGAEERLYVNGDLVDETDAKPPVSTEGELEIGAETEHGDSIEGRIDELRIYDRALSAPEVGLDMETPLQTPRTGPVAEWSFDEGKGTTATDLTGHGHTATISKATWTKGRFGNGLKFDGKKSCVTVANSAELNFTEEMTLEAWVRPTGSKEEGDPLIVQGDEAAGPTEEGYAYELLAGEHEVPKAWIREAGSGYQGIYGTEPLPENAWSHLTLTDDGAHLRLYVNGELVRTTVAPPLTTGSGPLQIGCDPWGYHFDGRIDEVRLYGRALTDAEVAGDMEAPVQTPKTGPVADYSFDEGSGETAEDLTGNGHTATLEGAEWTTHGRYGGALEFDAANEDFVSIPASTSLDGTEELTIEAWVRPTVTAESTILMKEREGSGPSYSYALYQYNDQPHGYFQESEEGVLAPSEPSLPAGAWTHLAITDNGAYSRLYVNGALVDTEVAIPLGGHGEIRLGGNSIWGEYFDGRIDEVRIYDRGLDTAEVDADMETPLQTPKAGPLASYSFDEDNEETQADTSGNGHTATVEGAKWTENGRYGGAMEFDASEGDYLTVPDSNDLDFTEEFTLEAWVRPQGYNRWAPIVAKETSPGENPYVSTYFLDDGDSTPGVAYGGTIYSEGELDSGEPLAENAWSHVALAYDGVKLRLYVDGQLIGEEAAAPPIATEGKLIIGGDSQTEAFFDGRIDELRIYNRSLNVGEVATDMAAPIQTPKQGPVAAYSFDKGSGETVEDVTGNGHTATIEGAEWTRGRYGSGLQFKNEGDCATVTATEGLQPTEEFTFESWLRYEGEGEGAEPFLTMEDTEPAEGHEHFSWMLLAGGEESPKAWLRDGEELGFQGIYGVTPIPKDSWTHIALTDDGVHLRLYVDGERVRTAQAPDLTTASGPLRLGCGLGYHFEGRIDETRLYDRALDEAEIVASQDRTQVSPAIHLSGTLTEGLSEGTSEYPLVVTATDYNSGYAGPGIRRIAVDVDGATVAENSTGCAHEGCTATLEWTYLPQSYGSGSHLVTATVMDYIGNQSSQTLELAEPDGDIPACNPLGGETPTPATETSELPGGGTLYTYETANGETYKFPQPPEGFDPLTATAAELEEYALPPRPSTSEKAAFAAWKVATSGSAAAPGTCMSTTGTEEDDSEGGAGAGVKTGNTYSGYEALDPEGEPRWLEIVGNFVQVEGEPDVCHGDSLDSWVGFGGKSDGLDQIGTKTKDNGDTSSFWNAIAPSSEGQSGNNPDHELHVPIQPGDSVYMQIHKSSTGYPMFFISNGHEGRGNHVGFIGGKKAKEGFDQSQVDFIDERPIHTNGAEKGEPFHLYDFLETNWTLTEAQPIAGGGLKPLGEIPVRQRVRMEEPGGKTLAVPDALKPSGNGFRNHWYHCAG